MTVTQVETPPPGADPGTAKRGWIERSSGILAPIITVVLAFLISGIVVYLTTRNLGDTLETYRAIFRGSGLSWFFEVGSHDIGLPFSDARVWFPWNTDDIESLAATNLQQTLILWTPLVLTGLAVAFAFRCGLFNIGGQGQYIAGSIGRHPHRDGDSGPRRPAAPPADRRLDRRRNARRSARRRDRRLPEGHGRGPRGDHDDHAELDRHLGRVATSSASAARFQTEESDAIPSSADIPEEAKLPVFWGDPLLQGLHIGLFVALAVARRLRVHAEPDDARIRGPRGRFQPGGRALRRDQRRPQLLPRDGHRGRVRRPRGLARLARAGSSGSTSPRSRDATIGFTGIAVALLGRNTAVGVGLAALLFAALDTGTASRNLDPEIFDPELASSLSIIIQGLVVLFVGAELVIVLLLARSEPLRGRGSAA